MWIYGVAIFAIFAAVYSGTWVHARLSNPTQAPGTSEDPHTNVSPTGAQGNNQLGATLGGLAVACIVLLLGIGLVWFLALGAGLAAAAQ